MSFEKSHWIMDHVQSTWFPLVDRNPHKYVPNSFKSKVTVPVKATLGAHRSAQHPIRWF